MDGLYCEMMGNAPVAIDMAILTSTSTQAQSRISLLLYCSHSSLLKSCIDMASIVILGSTHHSFTLGIVVELIREERSVWTTVLGRYAIRGPGEGADVYERRWSMVSWSSCSNCYCRYSVA